VAGGALIYGAEAFNQFQHYYRPVERVVRHILCLTLQLEAMEPATSVGGRFSGRRVPKARSINFSMMLSSFLDP
ncbi:MAG: hypothetical protein V7732_11100, partial [Halomonas aquamarina]